MKQEDDKTIEWDVLLSNTQTKKRTVDIVTLSRILRRAVDKIGKEEVANRLNISKEMIREFLSVEKLHPEIRQLVSQRRIDSVDAVREIASIGDQMKQLEFARVITDLSSGEIRNLKRLTNYGAMSPTKARMILMKARDEGLHVLVMMLDDKTYETITKAAKASGEDEVTLSIELLKAGIKHRGV